MEKILRRPADPAGLWAYSREMERGRLDSKQLAFSLLSSDEFRERMGIITDPIGSESHRRSLVVVDCEGYEKTLFSDPDTNRLAAFSDLIIECHDCWDDTITPSLLRALADTHEVEVVQAGGRNPNVFDFLAHLSDWARFQAVFERRGARMNWLVCRGRGAEARAT